MENMGEWIFKLIWVPIAVMITMCASVVLTVMFKDIGWDVPFRWLCIIGLVAYVADRMVNK
jgi:hypothetical protein